MSSPPRTRRVLIYSHDSFGLGHLRRCREIAHAMVKEYQDLCVLILSGSPIIGSFDFEPRVDFIRIPGVIKLRDGNYQPLKLPLALDEAMGLRASIIEHTARAFDPDLFLVDKEPLGLRGEVGDTLALMKSRGVPCVLGLRDVMDDPGNLAPEFERKNAVPALIEAYDAIWVYGLPQICDPLEGIDVPVSVRRKMIYTGYLARTVPERASLPGLEKIKAPYLLVTVGGGGDGAEIVEWVLKAYEETDDLPFPALLVLGPFMDRELQEDFQTRVQRLENVEAITFNAHIETLMDRASAVVGMGGYNTFCEILSLDKRALLIPRTEPRREQLIRTERAQDLGLVSMLLDDGERDARTMATALRRLPYQSRPSEAIVPGLLDGRRNVRRLTRLWLERGRPQLRLAEERHAATGGGRGTGK